MKQGQGGFALLAVLWLIAAASVLIGGSLAAARLGFQTTANRVHLARAEWAREACAEILLARYAEEPTIRRLEKVDLGRGTWCRASLEDPAAKLNLNTADREALRAMLPADSLVDAALQWRSAHGQFADVAQLRGVRGFDEQMVERLARVVTTRGTGVVNVNAAPREVLLTVPGLSEDAAGVIVNRREIGRPFTGPDELAGALSPAGRATLLAEYPDFVRATVFAPPILVFTVEGGVAGSPITTRATLTAVPVPGRLAVIRREMA
jgi:general secretion pathway protein K